MTGHAGVQLGNGGAGGGCFVVQECTVGVAVTHYNCITFSAEHLLQDPAFSPFAVADLAPVFEFRDDFHRHSLAMENPGDGMVAGGAFADVHFIALQADKAGQWEAGIGPGFDGCRGDGTGDFAGAGRWIYLIFFNDIPATADGRGGYDKGGGKGAELVTQCGVDVGCQSRFPVAAKGMARLERPHGKQFVNAGRSMSNRKPLVVITRRLPDVVETRMMELFQTRLNESDAALSKNELIQVVKEAEVLVPTVTDRIDAAVLAEAGEQLKLIANYGNGVDNIDVGAAAARGIMVTNTPGVLTEDTADMTVALILAVSRRVVEGAAVIAQDHVWKGWSPTWMLGRRIRGKRLGIIGMGRIGTALAVRARAFGLQIHYHNRKPVLPETEAKLEATYWESLDQMLSRVDIVSVNCPHTPATFHLLSARRLKLLKKDAILINTARGEIIDEAALVQLLDEGVVSGAGLDVFEHEPAVNPRLLRNSRVVLLPHMGSATLEGRIDMGEKVIINIKAWTDGHKPPDRVLPAAV